MNMYIGLDIHSKQTTFCVQDSNGTCVGRGSVLTTEAGFGQLLEYAPAGTLVALETGTQCKWSAQVLDSLGFRPFVVTAGEVRAKTVRRGQKTDDRDAFELCDGLRRNQWRTKVWIPTPQIDKLRELLSRRRHFGKIRTMEVNSTRFLLRSHGLRSMQKTLKTPAAWQALIARDDTAAIRDHLRKHFVVWHQMDQFVAELDGQIDQALQPFQSVVTLFDSMFGVGPTCTAAVIAAIGDPHRFASSNHVVSYAGLAPSQYDSGQRKFRGGITHEGPAYLRAILCESAQQAARKRHPLNPYYTRLAFKGKNYAVTAISAHILRILWRMWRDNKPFDLTMLNVEFRPQVRESLCYYTLKKGNQKPQPATR